jgi:hypothetical protein
MGLWSRFLGYEEIPKHVYLAAVAMSLDTRDASLDYLETQLSGALRGDFVDRDHIIANLVAVVRQLETRIKTLEGKSNV